jgi:hypothetical protein
MWNPRDIVEAAKSKEAGAFFGPMTDFMGKSYFVELVSKTPPDEKMWAEQWPKDEKQLRDQALAMEQNRRIEDYVAYLREDMIAKGTYQIDQAAMIRALGIEQDGGTPAEAAPGTTPEAPAATDGTATAPAAATATPAEAAPAAEAPVSSPDAPVTSPAPVETAPAPAPAETTTAAP